ncbi:MAG: SDR family NAD(P)-dependent oxidoreductase [Crenarchaeota archaeon]|nr:MAG: SDR family NAD(P)-dependent oxidoreductase [Thermoproteota archaeon]RDJ33855.1 MAG: SDR family NAD(P)-dependent oxidoreductase [Thermoproteota archaeon]RDJ37035.1 MAG: SDR family NAD(P)-dependent oxidoreductase [Thermoproteota archaeon]RDJ37430.1 MAG: SDR family NAD(P)-dependent oxidoreductase [Thermoproteota archaeon]
MRLQDKIAIITGASSDIGASIAKRFVDEGAQVVLLGRNLDSLEKVRQSTGKPDSAVPMTCDITDEAQVNQTVNQVMDKYGKIDILVNGAGAINDPVHFHDMQSGDIRNLIHVNMLGVFFPSKAVLGKMYEVKKGAIINIGSVSAERAVPRVHLAAYSSTKAAINMFTKSIAIEYARRNIRCNCINPGIINSGMIKPYLDDPGARKVLEERLPLNRIGEPIDVANTALFLASDEANWITGSIIDVDGGKSASEG